MIRGMIKKSLSAFDDLADDAEKAEETGDEQWLEDIKQSFLNQLKTVEDVASSTDPEDKVRRRLEDGDLLSEVISDYKEERLEELVENLPI